MRPQVLHFSVVRKQFFAKCSELFLGAGEIRATNSFAITRRLEVIAFEADIKVNCCVAVAKSDADPINGVPASLLGAEKIAPRICEDCSETVRLLIRQRDGWSRFVLGRGKVAVARLLVAQPIRFDFTRGFYQTEVRRIA